MVTEWKGEGQGGLRGPALGSCCVYFIKEFLSFLIPLIQTKGSLNEAALTCINSFESGSVAGMPFHFGIT